MGYERPQHDALERMLESQRRLQVDSFGADPVRLEGEARVAFIDWNLTALADELHELRGEIGWKPWATSRHVNEKEAFAELVDAWHFFMNIMWALGGESAMGSTRALAESFEAAYDDKRETNARRQREGYDGIAGKCPSCKRDRAETQLERELTQRSGTEPTFTEVTRYCPCGHVYETVMA